MVEKGVLGPTKAYFGTVENQGRGSLHLHILIWLDHDLTPSQLKESIKDEGFRKGLLNYLEDIIKEDLSKFTSDIANQDGKYIYYHFCRMNGFLSSLHSRAKKTHSAGSK